MAVIQRCAQHFAETHPEDTSRLVEQFSASDTVGFFETLSPNEAAAVLARMSPTSSAESLKLMEPTRWPAVLSALPASTVVTTLLRMHEVTRLQLLAALPDNTRRTYERLIAFGPDVVGSVTDPGALALPSDCSVGEALRQLRLYRGGAHHHIYVVDRDRNLIGVVHIRDLVTTRHKQALATLMHGVRSRIRASTSLSAVIANPAWQELDVLPVVDETNQFLGIVRHRDLRRIAASESPRSPIGPLLDLGELYWFALSALLPGISPPLGASADGAVAKKGGPHAG